MHVKEEKTEFVDLNRRFYKATDQNKPEEAAQESYMLDLVDREEGLNWPELLQETLGTFVLTMHCGERQDHPRRS